MQKSISIVRIIIFLLIMSAISNQGHTQGFWISDQGAPLSSVAIEELPTIDNAKLRASTRSSSDDKPGPYKFAEPITTSLSVVDGGTWESIEGDRMLWRQRVYSKGAYSLNFGMTDFYLPSSAVMFLYDRNQSYVIGPITQGANDEHNQWWSPIIPGEEVVVEVQINATQVKDLRLDITKTNHDFAGFGAALSGSCNVDVVCDGDDDESLAIIDRFRDIINSVGMYTLNGFEQCSGVLTNTTRNDCTPYFLTASHCDVVESNAASVVVYWNYQNSLCRLPNSPESGQAGDGSRAQFNSGSRVVADYDPADMTLLLLDDEVDPEFNPFFAGWDVDGEVFDSTLCIHHPNSEEKRISFDFDPNVPFTDEFFHRVNDWDLGTTEGGSSGSPLFSFDKQIIGLLTGGDAGCGNDLQDDYGMLKLSWEGGGTPQTRLKDWLDPDNTGALQTDGRFCIDVARATRKSIAICASDAEQYQVGVFITSGFDGGALVSAFTELENVSVALSADSIQIGDTVQMIITAPSDISPTEGLVEVNVSSSFSENRILIDLSVDSDVPAAPILLAPLNQALDVNFDIDFSWESTGLTHQIELSKDPLFLLNVQEISTDDKSLELRGLDSRTVYFWRVRSENACGVGEYSDIFQFRTGNIECSPNLPGDLPITISEEASTYRSVVTVVEEGTVADVNVSNIIGMHTWISDLSFFLISPAGTRVRLAVSPCEDEDDFNISFDDESNDVTLPCPLFGSTPYRPLDELSAFDGEEVTGDWILQVDDDARLDGGSLDSWTLELCINKVTKKQASFTPDEIFLCEADLPDVITLQGTLNGDYVGPISFSVVDQDGMPITATITPSQLTGSGSTMFTASFEDVQSLVEVDFINVITTDDVSTDTAVIDVVVPKVNPPILVSPLDGADDIQPRASFSWEGDNEETTYRVRVGLDSTLETVVLDTVVSETSFTVSDKLIVGTDYFWQATTIGECNVASSDIIMFTTDLVDAVIDQSLTGIEVFPNPAFEFLIINGGDVVAQKEVRFDIISTLGQIVDKGSIKNRVARINILSFEKGYYVLRLSTKDGIYALPFIKL